MPITDPPHRWDLVRPDQLDTLRELAEAAGQVIARAGGGEMFFVGQSPDSMFDLLSGALEGTDAARRLHRLAYSPGERHAVREVLGRQGLTPRMLARSHRPVALIDLVNDGGTFESLYQVVREWTAAEREPWSVIRRKLRFVGLTERVESSPMEWPAELPAGNVKNVSIGPALWDYLGRPVAEATDLVTLGRGREIRSLLVQTMTTEPAYAESWLRTLARQLGTLAG